GGDGRHEHAVDGGQGCHDKAVPQIGTEGTLRKDPHIVVQRRIGREQLKGAFPEQLAGGLQGCQKLPQKGEEDDKDEADQKYVKSWTCFFPHPITTITVC